MRVHDACVGKERKRIYIRRFRRYIFVAHSDLILHPFTQPNPLPSAHEHHRLAHAYGLYLA